MITLAQEYKISESMSPICLPNKDTKDMGRKVVTAGWGFTRVPGSCRTDGRGPKTFKDCSEGKCSKGAVPNTPKCKQLLKTISKELSLTLSCKIVSCLTLLFFSSDMAKFDVLKIDGHNCYNTVAKSGWCYTDKVKAMMPFRKAGKKRASTRANLTPAMVDCADQEPAELGLLHAVVQLQRGDDPGRAGGGRPGDLPADLLLPGTDQQVAGAVRRREASQG